MDLIKDLMYKLRFPQEAVESLCADYQTVRNDPAFEAVFSLLVEIYLKDSDEVNSFVMDKLKEYALQYGVHEYALTMLLLLQAGVKLKESYAQAGIDDGIYYRTMDDLRCKLLECRECEGVWGTFVGGWFHYFYRLKRFGLGRFQFEFSSVEDDYTMPDGTVIPGGTPCVGMHIPSSGISLTDEVRLDSYKRAFAFFTDRLYDGKLIIKCGSWLLYPKHREFLPESMNILRFMSDFDIIADAEKDGFSNDWRVFGRFSDLPYAELPEDTTLRRAYKNHLLETGKAGDGFGYIVFDGEKIVNRRA